MAQTLRRAFSSPLTFHPTCSSHHLEIKTWFSQGQQKTRSASSCLEYSSCPFLFFLCCCAIIFPLSSQPYVFTACGSCHQISGEPMALRIATGKREEVVTFIFCGNVNKGQRIRVGVDAEALALHDFQTSVLLKFFLMAFPSCPLDRGPSTLTDRTNDI